jgi:RHS repeat-associated protein
VWRWDQQEPFGVNPADENPSGLGAFDLPLRLPGQYYDRETSLHYNYFRDYDPSLGRYDPIGIRGGLNTYLYVSARPLTARDPKGLQQISSPEESPNTNPGQGAFVPGLCGSGWNDPLVWDNPFGFPFSPCCVAHDACYDDCIRKPTRDECDKGFCTCVSNVCLGYPVGIKQLCTSTAGLYCSQVTANGGPYFAAARAACPSCR